MFRRFLFYSLTLLCLCLFVGVGALTWLVVFAPGKDIAQGNIEKILAVESPVYYSDGQSKIGVFFEDDHRQYIPFERIPKTFVNAMVAAEDNRFFEHHGIDFKGLMRAMASNLRAGRVIQGGSTITQQTAKNLFKRKSRSFWEKFKELLYALRLEYHYPKEKILEFYVNQFYVSGNGRGLGVAARYYFDKAVEELDTVECAFIAGSVKKPNAYNPFIKRDEATVASAKRQARDRAGYVLGQMNKLGMLSPGEFEAARQREIPFHQGATYFSVNTVMDLVREAMSEPAIQQAFLQNGIENLATSGIRIYTTIEKDIQEQGLFAMRKELSRLDTRLLGYDRQEVQATLANLRFGNLRNLRPGGFLVGRIRAVSTDPDPRVEVGFQKGERGASGEWGRIDQTGLAPLLTALVRYEKQRWSEVRATDYATLLDRLKVGDLVYVSVKGVDDENDGYLLTLEKYPKLQGAAMALRQGRIRAMIGGMENSFFNRAVYARRPMGSVIKPLVYCAAMQLGWSSVDMLNNERGVFVFQNSAYFPRPDHISPHEWVSMSWAGVKSENLATIWLLYHLCDYLAPGNFKEVVAQLGLGRQPGESYTRYKQRIRDEYGVVVNDDAIRAAAFARAIIELEPDLIFSGRVEEYELLRNLNYGVGYARFLTENGLDDPAGADENGGKESDENAIRKQVLKRNFIRMQDLRQEFLALRQQLEAERPIVGATGVYRFGRAGRLIYSNEPPAEAGWQPLLGEELRQMFRQGGPSFGDDVLLDGLLSMSTVAMLSEALDREYEMLAAKPAYDDTVLHTVPDFRLLVALRYLMGMCRTLGIESPLDPVLSFPLGSNVVTLLEVLKSYEGMVGGGIFQGAAGDDESLAALIVERIEDRDGDLIYRPEMRRREIVDPQTAIMVSDILRNVVKYGTGRYADQVVRLHSNDSEREYQLQGLNLHVPVMGKTGTANRFTNAAFAGIVPGLTADGQNFDVREGYALGVYVGFDDNAPMVRKSTRISGATGALPIWARMANAILRANGYADKPDLVDYSFSSLSTIPLRYPALGQIEVPVDPAQGGKVVNDGRANKTMVNETAGFLSGTDARPTSITYGEISSDGVFKPRRQFRPYWQVEKKVQ